MVIKTFVFKLFAKIKDKDGEHLWHTFMLLLGCNTSFKERSFSELICDKQGRIVVTLNDTVQSCRSALPILYIAIQVIRSGTSQRCVLMTNVNSHVADS